MMKLILFVLSMPFVLSFDCYTCNSEPGEDDTLPCNDRKETCQDGVISCSMVTYRSIFDDKLHVRKFCTSSGTDEHDDLLQFPGAAVCKNVITSGKDVKFEPIPPSAIPLVRAKRIRRGEPPAPPHTNIDSVVCTCSTDLCNEGTPTQVMERSFRHDINRAIDISAKKIDNDIQEVA